MCPSIFPASSSSSLSLPDIEEVEVGTQTQQHNGRQHVVDELPEFRLQVTLPVPVYLREREGKRIIGGTAVQAQSHWMLFFYFDGNCFLNYSSVFLSTT